MDIELVVFMINWICLYAYFKGGEFNDFLSHIYWSFFIKSYFSYALVSSPIILYVVPSLVSINSIPLAFNSSLIPSASWNI